MIGWTSTEGPALADGPLAPFLAEAGFLRSGPGFRLPGTSAAVRREHEPDVVEGEPTA
jgi:hypothetical protein